MTTHPSEAREAMCRSCGAEILWAKTIAGRAIPLDREPSPDGNVEFTGVLDVVRVHATADPKAKTPRRRPHFATCPNADEWRSRR